MSDHNDSFLEKRATYPLVFAVACLVYAAAQFWIRPGFYTEFKLLDSDDAMRLLSVRDLIAGQGWFDTTQYRAVPPEGVSLHWSRFVDAPIAAIILTLSPILGMVQAEVIAVALWPAILFVGFLAVTGWAARSAFGNAAACLAVIAVAFLPMYGANYFSVGRIDHHNVQFLCMVSVFASIMARDAPLRSGVLAGVVAAFSLAVGLEAIVFLAMAGMVLTLRYVQGLPQATIQLLGYGGALGIAAPLFSAAQNGPSQWGLVYCDQLSFPFLIVTTWALGFSGVAWLLRNRVTTPMARIFVVLGTVGVLVMAVMALPELRHCLSGPFADVPDAVKVDIIGRISESLSAVQLIQDTPRAALTILLPTALVTVLVGLIWVFDGTNRRNWGELFAFLALGVLGGLWQSRAMVWGNAVLPIGFGAVFAYLIQSNWMPAGRARRIVMFVLLVLVVFPQSLLLFAGGSPNKKGLQLSDRNCHAPAALTQLINLPPAVVMAPLNMGANILLYTAHSVTGVPYHRSTDAMLNGVLPFERDGAELAKRVTKSGATIVVVCDGQIYADAESMGSDLGRGDAPNWLNAIDTGTGPLRVYRVVTTPN